MTKIVTTLGNLISGLSSYKDSCDIYLYDNTNYHVDNLCVIIDEGDDTTEVDNLIYVYGIYVLKDIIDNLYQQNPNFTVEDALKAMSFYHQNDAFI